jgi:hypothetical protein
MAVQRRKLDPASVSEVRVAYANPFETKRKGPAGRASSRVRYKIMAEWMGLISNLLLWTPLSFARNF